MPPSSPQLCNTTSTTPTTLHYEPYPTAHRALAGVFDSPERHGHVPYEPYVKETAQAELTRPRTPGTRWYYFNEWTRLPDTSQLQQALWMAQQDGLPQRRAAMRPKLDDNAKYRLERLRECIDVLLVQGNWTDFSVNTP